MNVGYICVKGPAIITAKHLKLPKGLKCVDPDKYILTLSDDGIFYIRFAIQTSNFDLFGLEVSPTVSHVVSPTGKTLINKKKDLKKTDHKFIQQNGNVFSWSQIIEAFGDHFSDNSRLT